MLTSWRHWCRLCARDNGTAVNMFLKNENDCNIVEELNKFFSISVSPLDEAPGTICNSCFNFLARISKFAERVSKVQAMFTEIIFDNISSNDCMSYKYQYGIVEDDWPVVDTVRKCEQTTDTNDLTIEFRPISEEFNSADNCDYASCSLDKIVSPIDRLDPLVELLEIEPISDRGSVDRTCFDDFQADDTVENDYSESDDIPLDKLKYFGNRKKKLKNSSNLINESRSSDEPCWKGFKRKSNVNQDKKSTNSSHVKKTSYNCSKCNRNFRTEARAKDHERIHLVSKPKYSCNFCKEKFPKQDNLRVHMRTVHISVRPFVCDSCGKTFVTKGGLHEHKFSHMETAPYQCSACPKKFKSQAQFKLHEDIHSGSTYICPNCGLVLNTKRTLQMHMVVHSDQKKYKCNFCGNEYKRAKALKNHLILHSGLRPYSCPFCDKTFANGSNCRSHKKKAHPQELAAMEAAGETLYATNIPKLQQLKAVPEKAKSASLSSEMLLKRGDDSVYDNAYTKVD